MMKHSVLLAILPLLGLAMASVMMNNPCEAAQAQAQPIYDTDGHELTKDNLYHILPADRNMSGLCLYVGHLTPADCPLSAFVARCRPTGGDAVMVMPAEASGGSVARLSSDVLLKFNPDTWTTCMMHLQWHVERDGSTGQMHVTMGHRLAAPRVPAMGTDSREKSFRFHVVRHGNGYKLASCREEPCRDLVLFDYDGLRWLTVEEEDGRQDWAQHFPLSSLSPATVNRIGDQRADSFSAGDSAALLLPVGLQAVGGGRGVESPDGSMYS